MTSNPAVTLRNVGKRYGQKWALEDISITIDEAKLVLIVGPNGAGKSTLLKIISGVVEPTKGNVNLFRENMSPSNPEARRRLGVLLHDSFLYDELTVRENLEFFHSMYGRNKTPDWHEFVDVLGMENIMDSKASELSYGWRKRADILRALIHHPRIVLFDELFSGLDEHGCQLVTEKVIPKVLGEETTVVVASHIDGYMRGLWHSKIRLGDGRLVSVERGNSVES